MEKYQKIKVVGKGSFGYAVLVQSTINKKYYIIKIIDISKMDRKQREEALNEVHVLKAMRHPYIITYRESFMEKRCLCIVMDFADGGDLYTKIAKQKEKGKLFGEKQILDWFVQMALALKHVHDRKILHRDLKTQNIFLTAKGDVKIGDFGISRVLQHTYDCAKTAIGTPYYLSPEICQEKPYNQKSDIWSLGCILYELTTLQHAFDANSMKNLVLKILKGNYPQIPDQYSSDLKNLISEMLIKDPAKRPSIRKLLEKDFLKSRIGELFSSTLTKHDLIEGDDPLQQQQQSQQLQQQQQNNMLNNNSKIEIKQPNIDIQPLQQNKNNINSSQQNSQQQSQSSQSNYSQYQQYLNKKDNNSQNNLQKINNNNNSNNNNSYVQSKSPLVRNNSQNQNYSSKENIQQAQIPPQRSQSPYTNQYSVYYQQSQQQNQQVAGNLQQQKQQNFINPIPNSINTQKQGQNYIQPPQLQQQFSNNSNRSYSKENGSSQQKVVNNQIIQENLKYIQDKYSNKNNNNNNVNVQQKPIFNKQLNQKTDDTGETLQEQGYGFLLESMKDCLNKEKRQNNQDDDENIEDSVKIVPKFLEIDGKPFAIPGTSERDTTGSKIEALRFYLEKSIGLDIFLNAYNIIIETNQDTNKDDSHLLLKLMGNTNIKFIPLIYQLIVCEESYYEGQNN